MAVIVVEYEFSPPITEEGLRQMSETLAPCSRMRRLRRLRTIVSQDGRRGFCEFEAPDAETVRDAYRSAGVTFLSVWPAKLYDGLPPSEQAVAPAAENQ